MSQVETENLPVKQFNDLQQLLHYNSGIFSMSLSAGPLAHFKPMKIYLAPDFPVQRE